MKRLTRIQGRSTEQVVDLDSDDIFNYPWVYAVQVQTWTFTDAEAKRLREYLLKGGFLMVDDFHGTADWENFMGGMRMVFPDRPVEDLENKDEIFHVLYDLDDRFQVPGEQYVNTGRTYEKDGYVPKWRAIRDDQGPHHGRDLPQHASRRRLGVGGHARVSGALRFHGFSDRARLHHLWNDALNRRQEQETRGVLSAHGQIICHPERSEGSALIFRGGGVQLAT